jgi:anti-anti-sigma factor
MTHVVDQTNFCVVPNSPSSFRLVGELDLASVAIFEAGVKAALDAHDVLTLDVSELAFLDSIGVRALFSAADTVGARGGHIVLSQPTKTVANTLDLVKAESWPHLIVHRGSERTASDERVPGGREPQTT